MKTLVMVLAATLAATATAAADPGAARDDKRSFDGRPLVMVGQGARVKDGQKLYDMQLWVDEQDGKRAFPALAMRAGGRDKARLVSGDHAQAFIVWGHFTKQAVIKFAQKVTAAEMRQDVKSALAENDGNAEALLALFIDADAGDEWVLTTGDNGQIELAVGRDKKHAPQSPKLERALWDVWLGTKPLSAELRHALIERIDVLGR